MFITRNVVQSAQNPPTTGCCISGYHVAYGSPVQTYVMAEFDTSNRLKGKNLTTLSHEVAEWADNPLLTNNAPAWGGIGQIPRDCQLDNEVGDPFTTSLLSISMPNGVTYNVTELAFFSWFFGGPSYGAGGLYSSNGAFTGSSKACPPGGTN